MPTGYTAKLYEGEQSFEEFMLELAGAFGFLYGRSTKNGEWVKELPFTVDQYLVDSITERTEKLAELRARTDEEWAANFRAHVAQLERKNSGARERAAALRARYERMRALCAKFGEGVEELESVRRLALEQLDTLKYDTEPYTQEPAADVETYKAGCIEEALLVLLYSTERYIEEVERVAERTRFAELYLHAIEAVQAVEK